MPNVLLALIPGFIKGLIPKKAPYCVWVRNEKRVWLNRNEGGNSARRCKKTRKVFLDMGIPPGDIMILPKGVTPI